MRFPHWQHFLSLEKDFVETIEYVELDPENNSTFSVVYTKLLLSICSEIDVVAKLLCKSISTNSSASNIDGYRSEITNIYPNFHTVVSLIPRYGLQIKPWSSWSGDTNPRWWTEHNKVKHERSLHSALANQENVIEALCGLFTLLLYFHQSELYSAELEPLPILLDYERMPGNLMINPGAELPDIPR